MSNFNDLLLLNLVYDQECNFSYALHILGSVSDPHQINKNAI